MLVLIICVVGFQMEDANEWTDSECNCVCGEMTLTGRLNKARIFLDMDHQGVSRHRQNNFRNIRLPVALVGCRPSMMIESSSHCQSVPKFGSLISSGTVTSRFSRNDTTWKGCRMLVLNCKKIIILAVGPCSRDGGREMGNGKKGISNPETQNDP